MLSQRKKQHIQYLYRGGGVPAVAGWLLRALLTPLYHREARYIVARKIPARAPREALERDKERTEGECLTVDSLDALRAVEEEIPASTTYPRESLRQYLAQGGVLFLVFSAPRAGHARSFVGYGIYQRGILSVLGREKAVPFNLLFGRYREMLPAHRGQRYSNILRVAREEYCHKHGVQFLCGTIAPDNRPSLKSALTRGGYQIIGTAVRVSLLRGRFVWETPWERIEGALQEFIQQERHS